MTFEIETFEGVLFPRQLDLTVAEDQRDLLAESRPDVAPEGESKWMRWDVVHRTAE